MPSRKKSRYANSSRVKMTDPGGAEYELVELREIPSVKSQFTATPGQGERVDLLAHRYYRESLLFWKILDASEHLDPFDTVVPGQPVAIPPNK